MKLSRSVPLTGSLIIAAALFFAVSFCRTSSAQTEIKRAPTEIFIKDESASEPGKTDRLSSVRRLIAQGAFISAINILENIYERQPEDRAVIELMLICYNELQAFTKAEMLIKRQLEKNPSDYYFYHSLIEINLKMGNSSSIDSIIEKTLERFPDNSDIYGSIIRQLVAYGFTEKAVKLIEAARIKFKQDNLFAFEAASVFEGRGAYYDAVMEYFKVAPSDSMTTAEVERRMGMLIRHQNAPPDIIKALSEILRATPNDVLALKMLEEAYIKGNQLAQAFEVCIRLDSLSKEKGKELFQYMRLCRERKMYEQVIGTAEYFDRQYAGNWAFSEYRFYYAEALSGLGKFREAIRIYNLIVQSHPHNRDRAEALMQIGRIYHYNLKIPDSARIFYDSAANRFPIASYAWDASMEIARLHILTGKLDSARIILSQLRLAEPEPTRKELIDYYLTMILFFQHQFRDADLGFRKIMTEYPRGLYVNDAIIYTLVISEMAELQSEELKEFADALYYEARDWPDSVEAKFQSIIDRGESPLAGLAGYRLAQFLVEDGDTSSALKTIDRMERDYPDNHFYPYCLKLKGDLFFYMSHKKSEAAEIYKVLLEKYGQYPFVGEIRKKLQELETQAAGPISEYCPKDYAWNANLLGTSLVPLAV
jgi:tetratricopeptide (TPR) repeat protein